MGFLAKRKPNVSYSTRQEKCVFAIHIPSFSRFKTEKIYQVSIQKLRSFTSDKLAFAVHTIFKHLKKIKPGG